MLEYAAGPPNVCYCLPMCSCQQDSERSFLPAIADCQLALVTLLYVAWLVATISTCRSDQLHVYQNLPRRCVISPPQHVFFSTVLVSSTPQQQLLPRVFQTSVYIYKSVYTRERKKDILYTRYGVRFLGTNFTYEILTKRNRGLCDGIDQGNINHRDEVFSGVALRYRSVFLRPIHLKTAFKSARQEKRAAKQESERFTNFQPIVWSRV